MSTNQPVGQLSEPSQGLTIDAYAGPVAVQAVAATMELFKPTKNISTFAPDYKQLVTDIFESRALIWVVSKDLKIVGVTVTSLVVMPYGIVLQFRYGRSIIDGIADEVVDHIIKTVKSQGRVDFVELEGRAGFSRKFFPKFGKIQHVSSIYRIPVE